ncbi:MAG: hypothetical protein WCE88_04290 [Burkholderiales bacterium]
MHVGDALDKLFSEFADNHAVTVYGEPSPQLVEKAKRIPEGSHQVVLLPPEAWPLIEEPTRRSLAERLLMCYIAANILSDSAENAIERDSR